MTRSSDPRNLARSTRVAGIPSMRFCVPHLRHLRKTEAAVDGAPRLVPKSGGSGICWATSIQRCPPCDLVKTARFGRVTVALARWRWRPGGGNGDCWPIRPDYADTGDLFVPANLQWRRLNRAGTRHVRQGWQSKAEVAMKQRAVESSNQNKRLAKGIA